MEPGPWEVWGMPAAVLAEPHCPFCGRGCRGGLLESVAALALGCCQGDRDIPECMPSRTGLCLSGQARPCSCHVAVVTPWLLTPGKRYVCAHVCESM